MSTITEQKGILRESGVMVHRNMKAPIDSIEGKVVSAFCRRGDISEIASHVLNSGAKNFSYYTTSGDVHRFATW